MNTQPNRGAAPVQMDEMLYMRERVQWQSFFNLRNPPHITDLAQLAKEIRRAYGK